MGGDFDSDSSGERAPSLATDSRFRRLLERSLDPTILQRGGEIVFANAAAAKLLGGGLPAQLLGRPLSDCIVPGDRPISESLIEEVSSGRRAQACWPARIVRIDGSELDVELTAAVLEDQRPATLQIRARNLQAARPAGARSHPRVPDLELIAGAFPDLYFWLEPDGTITHYHCGAGASLYLPPEEFLGHRMQDVLPPEVGRLFSQALEQLGESRPVVALDYELPIRNELHCFEARLLPSADGGVVVLVRETTERRRAEQALEREQRFIAAVLDTAGALVTVLDREGRIVRFNRACEELTGYRRDEVEGRRLWDLLLLPEEMEGVQAVFADLAAGNFPNRFENHWVAKNGTRHRIAWTNTALCGEAGEVDFVIATGLDITGQRQLEEEFLQAQKMEAVGRLAGGLAHDFNNILMVVAGRAEQLEGRVNDEFARPVQEIRKAAKRATSLTRQLLTFSSRQPLQPRLLELGTVVSEFSELLQRMIGEDVELVTRFAPDLGFVEGDRGQIEQVIMNLAVNARDAMPQGGRLTLEAENLDGPELPLSEGLAAGSWIRMTLTDTGHGMDEGTRIRAFEPFFTTKPAGKGTGLGLSTAYGIVRQTGGEIHLESTPSRGTRVQIYLPRVEAKGEVPSPAVEGARSEVHGSETILLVEDDESTRELLSGFLSESGFRVIEAVDGAAALHLFEAQPAEIDLVITDCVMPTMSGPDFVSRIREIRASTRVLYISGYTNHAIPEVQLRERGVGFLHKPFELGELAASARSLLDSSP